MSLSGPIQKRATVGDGNAAATAWFPQDVLASILVRLPASDLRRIRRVCKEWREIISSPAFIEDHGVHGPRTLTHTILFFPGQPVGGRKYSDNGCGFLLDDQWRLKATFSAPRFDEMIGQCNGLLCFLDGCERNRAMYIVEPFSGESLTLPLPPWTDCWREPAAYCFGFDSGLGRYKVFHHGQRYNIAKQELYVYTIGGDESWRMVQAAGNRVHGVHHGDPVFANGAVYWSVVRGHRARLARFDLATEELTSESVDRYQMGMHLAVMTDSEARVRVMTVRPSHGRSLARPHALQRDQLLLNHSHGGGLYGLYAHAIAPASNGLGRGELLFETLEDYRLARCTTQGLFVPVQFSQKPAGVARRTGYNDDHHVTVFCYAPPVSPAPLAHYFGKI